VFERFTPEARDVVVQAQTEARLLDHNYIGTEHVLLGLLAEPSGTAYEQLVAHDVSLDAARGAVEQIIGRGSTSPPGHIPFTPRAKKALELALREALRFGQRHIGTEHILLGVLRIEEGVAVQALERLGVDVVALRSAVEAQLPAPAAPEGMRGVRTSGAIGRAGRIARSMIGRLGEVTPGRERPSPEEIATLAAGGAGAVMGPTTAVCSFCGQDLWDAEHYVSGGAATICDRCVTAATAALEGATGSGTREVSLPPRVYGDLPPDGERAVGEIVAAFGTWHDGSLPAEDRAAAIERGETIVDVMREMEERWGGRVAETAVSLQRLRFAGNDRADIRYAVRIGGGAGPVLEGAAIRTADGWKISRDTFCALARLGGVRCPPSGAD
jgi:ATP-dependent Clp protease ATP-binding subunit ClpC